MKKIQRGFTVVEVLIVGVLAAIVLAVTTASFFTKKADCDQKHPSDQSAALRCLHNK